MLKEFEKWQANKFITFLISFLQAYFLFLASKTIESSSSLLESFTHHPRVNQFDVTIIIRREILLENLSYKYPNKYGKQMMVLYKIARNTHTMQKRVDFVVCTLFERINKVIVLL